jgi:hypothetical protein
MSAAFWQEDGTFVAEKTYETTAESDEVLSFDTTKLLVSGGAPSSPQAALFIVQTGADATATLQEQPTVSTGNTITQRLRGLTAGVTYRYRLSFLTSGNRRAVTLICKCVE